MTLTEEQREAIRVISKLPMAIGCQLCHPYIMKNYGSHFIVLRAMIDSSEHVTDHTKMIGFDLEKVREAVHILENFAFASGKIAAGQIQDVLWGARLLAASTAEIERLRASLVEHEEHENQTHEVLGNILGTDDTLENVAKRAAARIKELEDALVEERARVITSHPLTHVIDEDRTEASMQLQAEGKIGPDAETGNRDHVVGPDQMVPNGKVWQITEERKAAIDRGLQFLEWSYAKNSAHDTKEQIAVLWAMLDEDTHDKP